MGASRAASVSRGAVLALAGLGLAACASVGPRYPLAGNYAGGSEAYPQGSYPPGPRASAPGRGANKPYEINGRWYYPAEQPDYDQVGIASWYGEQFHNHTTADGEVFDMNLPSAAHKTLPLPSLVEVTNLANGRKIVVRVNDRGPFVDGRIIDMSKEAAKQLGFYGQGTAQVRVRYVGRASDLPRLYQASAAPQPAKPAPARPRPEDQTGLAASSPILGPEIDDRPLQASPSTMTWTTASQSSAPQSSAPQSATPQSPPPVQAAPPSPRPVQVAAAAPVAVSSEVGSTPSSDIDDLLSSAPDSARPAPPAVAPAPAVQTGAFASRANAERAAAPYGGQARIVPVEQGGRMLYKVMVAQ